MMMTISHFGLNLNGCLGILHALMMMIIWNVRNARHVKVPPFGHNKMKCQTRRDISPPPSPFLSSTTPPCVASLPLLQLITAFGRSWRFPRGRPNAMATEGNHSGCPADTDAGWSWWGFAQIPRCHRTRLGAGTCVQREREMQKRVNKCAHCCR